MKLLDKENIAFVRLEQLYPFPETQLKSIFSKYGKDCKYVWAQEEPLNMGPWSYILRKWEYSKMSVFF